MTRNTPINVLLIEDNPTDVRLVQELLHGAPSDKFFVTTASTLAQGLERLSSDAVDVILLDLGLPDSQSLDTFQAVAKQAPGFPIIILTVSAHEELGVKAIRAGAQRFFSKDTLTPAGAYADMFPQFIHHAIEHKRMETELKNSHEHVQSLNEQLRSANEELWISNEELEVLAKGRSAELATANEELAATNEELKTINAELRQEVEYRILAERSAQALADDTAAVNEIIHAVNDATQILTLYERVVNSSIKHLGFDKALIAVLAGSGRFSVRYAYNLPSGFIDAANQLEVDSYPNFQRLYKRQEVVTMETVPCSSASYQFGLRGSAVAIPLVSEGTTIGHVSLHWNDRRSFTTEDEEIFRTIGRELGTAVANLTERQQAETRAAMLDNAYDAIVAWDANDDITYWNYGAERLYGWPHAEALRKNVHALLQTTFPQSLKRIKSTLSKTGRWQGELTHVTQAGATVIVESHMTLLRADDGSSTTLEINTDVTRRKRTERRAHVASLYARSLIEASVDPFVVINAQGKITDVNKATEAVTGYSRDQLIGSDFSGYFTEPSKANAGYKQVFVKGVIRDYPLAIRHKSGAITDVLFNATVFTDERGNVAGVFAAARDVTDQKRADQQVGEAARYARELIEASLDPLVTINAEGKITDVNQATEKVTGYVRKELIGSDFSTYFTEPKKARAGYQQVFSDGLVRDYPLAIRHKSGRVTDVLYHAAVYRDERGEVQGVFAAARDITDQKRAQEELQRYSDHLEDLVEERTTQLKGAERLAGIGETAAMIGHDLRNPLQGLQYIVDMQRMRFDRTPPEERNSTDWKKSEESFDRIAEQIFYMDKIVGDLQDYARPLQPQPERMSLNNLVEDVLEQVPRDGSVRVATSVKGIFIEADRHLMHRAFSNIILNALQAMSEGGTLTINGSASNHAVVVTFHDTGVGIPAAMMDKLFSPLITGKAKGTGLGLAVVKRIVDAHGGTITFKSEEGNGTAFTITLPKGSAE